MRFTIVLLTSLFFVPLFSQNELDIDITGRVFQHNESVPYAKVMIAHSSIGTITDSSGTFELTVSRNSFPVRLIVRAVGFQPYSKEIALDGKFIHLDIQLTPSYLETDEMVVSGTMKEVSRSNSPVPVEIYKASYFKANPTPSVFEALQNVNGVRPQVNCSVCNTGDIHINGLEGPYTMVLIDGMPIVSGLSTVYGLFGIPQSLIERVEIVKGPASTLYGSEAVGGLINIITTDANRAPLAFADAFVTTYGELNADFATKWSAGKKWNALLGANHFRYDQPVDLNQDGFTDVTLQNRFSLFNKWQMQRPENRIFSLAARAIYEDRWGGQMDWSPEWRGTDSIYGESIYTRRYELFGAYALPVREKLEFRWSANRHEQDSYYGTTPYVASQDVAFGQLTWQKHKGRQEFLMGAAYRFTGYDDNTPATSRTDTAGVVENAPSAMHLPGIFVQDQITIDERNTLLLGMRYDYNTLHGNILTPRLNYKFNTLNDRTILRLSVGNGYRVANVFTEDHAALTGSRSVVFTEELRPETSWNTNFNWVQRYKGKNGHLFLLDASLFFTHFTNRILPDYESDPNLILYGNLDGFSLSRGFSMNLEWNATFGLNAQLGVTLMDVSNTVDGVSTRQLFTEQVMGTWKVSYTAKSWPFQIDYTGNLHGPMRLPLLSDLDPRPAYSPWWSIQNIQLTYKLKTRWEFYGGVKNLLNWTPAKNVPFIIARSHDPFDKNVSFDAEGNAMATPLNPYALTFDPTYSYASNQGIRGFLGIRLKIIGKPQPNKRQP